MVCFKASSFKSCEILKEKIYEKEKIVRMLKEMQKTVYNSDMFEKAGPQQKWVIENLLGNAIAELDGYPYAIGLKNKNLIESKVVHPESEYDYVDRFDDDEAELLNYDCRYSYSKPDLKDPFLITKEMIAIGIYQTIFNFEEQGDGKIKVILYPSNVRFTIGIESLSISSDIRKVEIIFSYLRTQYRSMDAKLFNKIPENSPASVGSGMNPVFLYVKSFFFRNLSYLS